MKQNKPIVFMTQKELQEAMNLKIIQTTINMDSFPWMKCLPLSENGGQCFASWEESEIIKLLQQSALWSDIREQYLPRPWYELHENIGKVIMVKNKKEDEWEPNVFSSYIKKLNYSYKVINTSIWKYARQLTPEDYELVNYKKD